MAQIIELLAQVSQAAGTEIRIPLFVGPLVAGLGIVPHTGRLAWVVVVVMGAKDKHGGGRDQPTHPADGPNQLCHRVLGGDRVVQQRGVQRPPVPALW